LIILRVSGQVKDITKTMFVESKKQGEDLVKIDGAVVEVKENVVNAEEEIRKAEEESRGNSCKIIWIASIIFFVVLAIILIVVFTR